jgi:hypothetical protein
MKPRPLHWYLTAMITSCLLPSSALGGDLMR